MYHRHNGNDVFYKSKLKSVNLYVSYNTWFKFFTKFPSHFIVQS